MQCAADGCVADSLRVVGGTTNCLAHVADEVRSRFLEKVVGYSEGLAGRLHRLDIDQSLLEELLPAIRALHEEPVEFDRAVFSGDVDFGRTVFRVPVSFEEAQFRGRVSFERAIFRKSVSFAAVVFSGSARFGSRASPAAPSERSSHDAAVFAHDIDLTGAEFVGDALFEDVQLGHDLRLDRTSFHGECRFVIEERDLPDALETRRAAGREPGTERTISLRDTRFRDGAVLSFPSGRVDSEDMEFGDATRIEVSGPLTLDSIASPYPLIVLARDNGTQGGGTAEVTSFRRSVVQAPVIVGDGVRLHSCVFEGTRGLEWLRLPSEIPIQRYRRRRVLAEEQEWWRTRPARRLSLPVALPSLARRRSPCPAGATGAPEGRSRDPLAVAGTYRQLRQGLEDAKNSPGAADFYYGEMEMRRVGSKRRAERVILHLYWLLSGYGLRVWRSLAWLVGVVGFTAFALRSWPGTFQETCAVSEECPDLSNLVATANFVVRWAISFQPTPGISGISTAGESLLIGVRILTPVLVALTVLALRSRVHR